MEFGKRGPRKGERPLCFDENQEVGQRWDDKRGFL